MSSIMWMIIIWFSEHWMKNIFGSSFLLYLWYNSNTFVFHDIFNFEQIKRFNNGSAWALYLLHVIIQTAPFCSINSLSNFKTHDNTHTQYCRWDRIKLLYKILNIFWGKICFNLHKIPSDLNILFDVFFCTCLFHVKCWLIVKTNKSKSVIRSFKSICGIGFSMLRCL